MYQSVQFKLFIYLYIKKTKCINVLCVQVLTKAISKNKPAQQYKLFIFYLYTLFSLFISLFLSSPLFQNFISKKNKNKTKMIIFYFISLSLTFAN